MKLQNPKPYLAKTLSPNSYDYVIGSSIKSLIFYLIVLLFRSYYFLLTCETSWWHWIAFSVVMGFLRSFGKIYFDFFMLKSWLHNLDNMVIIFKIYISLFQYSISLMYTSYGDDLIKESWIVYKGGKAVKWHRVDIGITPYIKFMN